MLARRLPGILPRLPPDEALEITRIHSVAGLLPSERPLVSVPPFRAPHHTRVGLGDRRRRPEPAARRSKPRAPRRPVPGRAGRVPAERAGGAAPAARGRRDLDRPRRRPARLSGAFPARRDDEPLPLRSAGRPGCRMLVLGCAPCRISRQAVAGAARSLRPGRHGAATARAGARGGAGRGVGGRARARRSGARGLARSRSAARSRQTNC